MNKDEMYIVESYKCKELRQELEPITNWDNIKVGTEIFHNTDTDINNINTFIEVNEDVDIISYYNKYNEKYNMSTTDWYKYDRNKADKVKKHYTPKLYWIYNIDDRSEYDFIVAYDKKQANKEFLKEIDYNISLENFDYKFKTVCVKEIDGFKIVCE